MNNFNKKMFKQTLRKAIADERPEIFASKCKISYSIINKYLLELLDILPPPLICKKISNISHNNVSFEKLMLSAGYTIEDINEFYNKNNEMKLTNFAEKYKTEKKRKTGKNITIKELLQQEYYTAVQIAKLANKSPSYIKKRENLLNPIILPNGRRRYTKEHLDKILNNEIKLERKNDFALENNLIPISKFAKTLNINKTTLRKWDTIGKLKAIKDSKGFRYYTNEQLIKLQNEYQKWEHDITDLN